MFDEADWVSGLVGYREARDRVQLVSYGVRPDRQKSWRNGALSSAIYFALKWAREHGVRYVDFGGTRPHTDDGVFHHKSLWGAQPKREPWHHNLTYFYVAVDWEMPPVVANQLVWDNGEFQKLGADQASGKTLAPCTLAGSHSR